MEDDSKCPGCWLYRCRLTQRGLTKGVNGLGIKCDVNLLSLVCSSGMVPDAKICGRPWTLGEYIHLNGGVQNRSKKTWGILVPVDDEDTAFSTADSVTIMPIVLFYFVNLIIGYVHLL